MRYWHDWLWMRAFSVHLCRPSARRRNRKDSGLPRQEPRMTPAERLAALRAGLRQAGVEGFLIPRADEHLGEYVPPSGERLAWLSGFTGSAGLAAVLDDRAALFTDGRYTTQAQQQLDPALWELRHIIEQPAVDSLKE